MDSADKQNRKIHPCFDQSTPNASNIFLLAIVTGPRGQPNVRRCCTTRTRQPIAASVCTAISASSILRALTTGGIGNALSGKSWFAAFGQGASARPIRLGRACGRGPAGRGCPSHRWAAVKRSYVKVGDFTSAHSRRRFAERLGRASANHPPLSATHQRRS